MPFFHPDGTKYLVVLEKVHVIGTGVTHRQCKRVMEHSFVRDYGKSKQGLYHDLDLTRHQNMKRLRV